MSTRKFVNQLFILAIVGFILNNCSFIVFGEKIKSMTVLELGRQTYETWQNGSEILRVIFQLLALVLFRNEYRRKWIMVNAHYLLIADLLLFVVLLFYPNYYFYMIGGAIDGAVILGLWWNCCNVAFQYAVPDPDDRVKYSNDLQITQLLITVICNLIAVLIAKSNIQFTVILNWIFWCSFPGSAIVWIRYKYMLKKCHFLKKEEADYEQLYFKF